MRASSEMGIAKQSRLEYGLAFDLVAAWLASQRQVEPRIAVLASAPVFVREVILRSAVPITIMTDSLSVDDTVRRLTGAVPTTDQPSVDLAFLGAPTNTTMAGYSSAVWASPQPGTWRRHLQILDNGLADRGALAVFTAGYLGCLLAPFRRDLAPGEPRWPAPGLRREIERRGYRAENVLSIGGPAAIGWAALRRIASITGRHQFADRYEAGYRLALVPSRHQRLAVFALLLARKERRER